MTLSKRKHFNTKLYIDALRQLKLTGFILAIIVLIISLIPVLVSVLSHGQGADLISVDAFVPVMWGYMFVGGAGLVFSAFSFLNKRAPSDFWHSLPNTAFATWASLTAACATWIVATVASNVLVTYFAYLLAGIKLTPLFIIYSFGYFTIGTLLVMAAASIAVCITGTRLTNLVLTSLILFLPRFVTTLLSFSIVQISGNVIPFDQTGILFNPAFNITTIPLTLFVQIATLSGSSESPIGYLPSFLYSATLTLFYLSVAAYLYTKRRSETAGIGAPSKLMQHIYRSAMIIPLLIILPTDALSNRNPSFANMFEPTLLIIILSLSVIVYFTYELITTKSFKNLLRAAPLFLALVLVVPTVTYFGTYSAAKGMLRDTPSSENIKGIYLVKSYNAWQDNLPGYAMLRAESIKHEDKELYDIVAKALARTVEEVEAQRADRPTDYMSKEDYIEYRYKTLRISKGVASIVRTIKFTADEYEQVESVITSNPKYQKVLRESIPSDSEVKNIQVYNLGKFDTLTAWSDYVKELELLSDEEMVLALEDRYNAFFSFDVVGYYGLNIFKGTYPVGRLTPKTATSVMNQLNNTYSEKFVELATKLAEYKSYEQMYEDDFHVDIFVRFFNFPGQEAGSEQENYGIPAGPEIYNPEQFSPFYEIIKDNKIQNSDTEGILAFIRLRKYGYYYYYSDLDSEAAYVYVNIDPTQAQSIMEMLAAVDGDPEHGYR